MDCSLPGFSVHWIFQARVPEWVAISFSNFLAVSSHAEEAKNLRAFFFFHFLFCIGIQPISNVVNKLQVNTKGIQPYIYIFLSSLGPWILNLKGKQSAP